MNKQSRNLLIFLGIAQNIPVILLAGMFLNDSKKYGDSIEYSFKSERAFEINCDTCQNYYAERSKSENQDDIGFQKFPKDSVLELKCDSILDAYRKLQTQEEIHNYVKGDFSFLKPGF